MGRLEVLMFLRDRPDGFFTIREIADGLGVTERTVRRDVVYLEANHWIVGRCRGNYRNWNREFKIKL